MAQAFVQFEYVQEGDLLIPDGGFDCLAAGEEVRVCKDKDGLYVPCLNGNHYLDGQHDEGTGELIGLWAKVAA